MTSINQSLSLYIPCLTRRITIEYIITTFENMRIGKVSKVDLVETADGRRMTGYVHFSEWYDTKENLLLQQRINDPNQQARLVYDAPWYWILLVNMTNTKPAEKKVIVATDFPPLTATASRERGVDAQNTFASVLRGTTVRPPPIVVVPKYHLPPTTEDIVEMTQMAMECDEEYEANCRARNQPQTAASSAQTINQELLVIIEDLQSRLARCEQMIVNSITRSENINDTVSYLVSANYHTTTQLNGVDARLSDVEYDVWPNEATGVVSDAE